jgi:hypothetical protein
VGYLLVADLMVRVPAALADGKTVRPTNRPSWSPDQTYPCLWLGQRFRASRFPASLLIPPLQALTGQRAVDATAILAG